MEDSAYFSHYSVMLADCLEIFQENFKRDSNGLFADMTFGAGGHSLNVAKSFPRHKVISVDQDPEAFANGLEQIKVQGLENQVKLLRMNFSEFP